MEDEHPQKFNGRQPLKNMEDSLKNQMEDDLNKI
jgi:hypothetical protein